MHGMWRKNFTGRQVLEELPLTSEQKLFLKRLLKIEPPYSDADQIADDFQKAFSYDKEV